MAFSIVVIGNSTIFEVKKAATALSVPMFAARVASSLSPLISTLSQPWPTFIFCATTSTAAIFSQFLQSPPTTTQNKKVVV